MANTDVRAPSPRIAALRDGIMERGGSFVKDQNPFLRDVALWRATGGKRSRVQIRAAFLRELVGLADIEIHPGWQLAGEHLLRGPSASFAFRDTLDTAPVGRIRELGIDCHKVDSVRETVRTWMRGTAGTAAAPYYAVGEAPPEQGRSRGSWGDERSQTVYWASGWIENHSVRGYARVLQHGFQGIRDDVVRRLNEAELSDPSTPQKENFWRAALYICEAGIMLGERYANLAAQLAEGTPDSAEKARLWRMAEMCTRVPARGARTFAEAVQSLWLAHILTCGEDGINANSIGRLDQMLHPWYERDVRDGRLTRREATELMEELACKLYLDYDVQAITLGGLDAQGRDATNDLSYIILEATRNVGIIRDVSVRLHKQSPTQFVRLAAELIAQGGGVPFIFNDDCFVQALSDRGIALRDARDYAPIGCIELTIPGRANPHAVSGWFNSTKCLELALFDGRDPQSAEQLGPRTGNLTDMASFQHLFDAYCRQVDFFGRKMVYHCNRGELAQRERGPLPCWSVLTDDCIARGRDITDGGAVYNYHSVCFLGTANTADSMMAIKSLVFEDRQVTADQVLEALTRDFQGYEPLRQKLLRRAPKYGNDHPAVDALARQIDEHFISLMDSMESPLRGRYYVHLFSFKCNLPFGKTVGATPDGRRAGEPLAYSLSAHQGRDEKGVTAMLNSLSRLPHSQAAGASAAIIDIDPALIAGDEGIQRLADMIQGAIELGVGQLQWNVTTAERLEMAQQDPEHYGNIAVRVAGYSQLFKLIDKELQDHIIARTKHRN